VRVAAAFVLFAASVAACDAATDTAPESVKGLRLSEGETSQFVRWFTLTRGDEVQLVIAQKLSVTREAADEGARLAVTCDRARVWIGESDGAPDFDSETRSVADVMAEPEGDMAEMYAATWAEAAMVGVAARLDPDGNVTLLEARTGELEPGDEEEDAALAVLAEAINRPESLLVAEFDASWRERPTRNATAFGPRVEGNLRNKGKLAWGDTEETWGSQGSVTTWAPDDRSVSGRLIFELHVSPPARPHKMTWRLTLEDGGAPLDLSCEVTRAK